MDKSKIGYAVDVVLEWLFVVALALALFGGAVGIVRIWEVMR